MEYILFVGQEGSSQSRCMLIPAKEYIEHNRGDYDIMRKHVKTITLDGVEVNVLLNYLVREGIIGHYRVTEYSEICQKLTSYADRLDEECYYDLNHKVWVDKCIGLQIGGFNHVKNYEKLKNPKFYNKPIIIVDSFLFIECENNILYKPSFDTVEEMLLSTYPNIFI